MTKKTIPLFIITILLASALVATTVVIDSFLGEINPLNITFNGSQNTSTTYLKIPRSSYLQNLTFTLDGVISKFNVNLSDETLIGFWRFNESDGIFNDYKTNSHPNFTLIGNESNVRQLGIAPSSIYSTFADTGTLINNSNITTTLNSMENFTIIFWLGNVSDNGAPDQNLMAFMNASFNTGWRIFRDPGQINWQIYNISGQEVLLSEAIPAFQKNTSFAFKKNGTHIAIYENGVEVETSQKIITIDDITEGFYIGSRWTGTVNELFLDGSRFDELYIYNRSLAAFEIENIYNNGLYNIPSDIKGDFGSQDGDYEIGIDGTLYFQYNYSSNITQLNNILNSQCSCTGCVQNASYCLIPFTFKSSTNGTLLVNLTNATYEFGLDRCNFSTMIPNVYNATALHVKFLDISNSPININLSNLVSYSADQINYYNFSYTNLSTNNYRVCIYPAWANLTSAITTQYQSGSSFFNYFSNGTYLNNITKNISLYAEEGTPVIATVFDNINDLVEGAYIQVQRYDFDSGNYLPVGQAVTNFQGETTLYLTLNSVFYRFLIYYPIDQLKEITEPVYVYSTSIEFRIDLYADVAEDFYTTENLDYSLTFNNLTNNIKYIFSDTSASISGACLKIWKTDPRSTILINNTCLTTTSGTILTNVEEINFTTYLAKAYVNLNGDELFINSLSVQFFGENTVGSMGLVIVLMITIVFGFLFLFSIPLAVIVMPLPTLLASMINLIHLDVKIAIGLEIVAFIIAILINDRG